MINGVVTRWARAVASGIFHLDLKIGVDFLAGLHSAIDFLALVAHEIAAIEIYAVFGVNPIAMMLEQPFDAVEVPSFFIGGEREDQIAVRREARLFHADKIFNQNCGAVFDVHGAATVEIAVFLDKLKRIGGPVFAAGLDDVQVGEKQDWFLLTGSMQARDEILLVIVRSCDDDVLLGEPGVAQPLG